MIKLMLTTVVLCLFVTGFSQGKDKGNKKEKAKTEKKVPAPQDDPSKMPEVKNKPQIFQETDTSKNPMGNKGKKELKNNNKNKKDNEKDDEENEDLKDKNNRDKEQWNKIEDDSENRNGKGNSKVRKNIPTQVRNSFNADYPNAVNAVWRKQQGDWTVTFGNNVYKSVATYHSNGERVDTRTNIPTQQAPESVLGEIRKRFPQSNPKDIIKIEKPKNPNLFQVMIEEGGKIRRMLFDEKGKLISEQ